MMYTEAYFTKGARPPRYSIATSGCGVTCLDQSGLFRRRIFATARAYDRGCNIILGCRPGVSQRTVGAIELVLDIFTIRTNPKLVEASNSQPSAIRKNDGFSSVVDQEAHTFFNLDQVLVSSLIGHNDFSTCTIVLSARLLRPAHLHLLCKDSERQTD